MEKFRSRAPCTPGAVGGTRFGRFSNSEGLTVCQVCTKLPSRISLRVKRMGEIEGEQG